MFSFFNTWIATPLMAFEFLLFGFLFSLNLKRRDYFFLRFIPLGVMEIGLVVAVEFLFSVITGGEYHYGQVAAWDYRQTIFRFLFFLAIYVETSLVLAFSFKERATTIFLVSAASFASQHIAYNVFALFALLASLIEDVVVLNVLLLTLRLGIMGFMLGLAFFFNKREGERANPYEGNTKRKIVASFIVVLICIGLFRLQNDLPSNTAVVTIGFSLYAIVSCCLLLMVIFGLLASDKTHAEAEAYRELLHEQKTQYELSKRNIDLINMKCHDLKHQIRALKTVDNEAYIQEIEQEVMIYDSSLKTGNEVLDVILREKMLQCQAEGITMTCLLDGSSLAFMEEMDIYSLFGNLLSNAFECVQKIEEKERRTISISGRTVEGMFILNEENYVNEQPVIEDGLPKTTKKDAELHGFGMKSMRRVAEKYGGEMAVKCLNGKFSIAFVFPLPNQA